MNKSLFDNFVEELQNNIRNNYHLVINAFEQEYGWPEVDPIRNEICKCIICGFHQASITLTNHILESALKKALIIEYSAKNKTECCNINSVFDEATAIYADKDLEYTINQTCRKGLISKEEKKLLRKYKEQFRNAFSHADPQKIFSNIYIPAAIVTTANSESSNGYTKKSSINLLAENNVPIQGIVQSIKAEQQSIYYFLSVDKIIRNMHLKLFDTSRYNTQKQ
jgi:hypothetical protein